MEELCGLNSCKTLLDSNTVKGLFKYENKLYACTGTLSSGSEGWISATVYEAIPLENKLLYPENRYLRKERGYVGREFSHQSKPMLMLGPAIEVKPIGKPLIQYELF